MLNWTIGRAYLPSMCSLSSDRNGRPKNGPKRLLLIPLLPPSGFFSYHTGCGLALLAGASPPLPIPRLCRPAAFPREGGQKWSTGAYNAQELLCLAPSCSLPCARRAHIIFTTLLGRDCSSTAMWPQSFPSQNVCLTMQN